MAHNVKVVGNVTETYIDLYRVVEWTSVQIRTTGENFFPPGEECEFETLLLNRVEGSVSLLLTPGPAAATKPCVIKPKTVVYKLEIGPPKF